MSWAKMTLLLGAAATLLLGACSPTRYCTGTKSYQETEVLPPLKGTDELTIPQSQSALLVPPGLGTTDGFSETYVDAEGKSRERCLDLPPRMQGS